MRIFGWQESAIAIITRWRWPPESWNGYSFTMLSTRGRPVSLRMRMVCSRASALDTPWCSRIASATCSPIFSTGLRLVMGSWKIMEISLPRIFLRSSSESLVRSLPSKRISPSTIRPVVPRNKPMMESDVTLFPLPDSPTMPRVDPSFNAKLKSSTALIVPLSVKKYVFNPFTSRILFDFILRLLIVRSAAGQAHCAGHPPTG